ncbi:MULTISPECIES: hypothetical protein [Pseudomonas]|uniref:hypothetical protein n=1 Tax=Pseudomonas TaxID=286 RepID=UPI0005A72204|nr:MULTISPECIES: hypothetical protein [Pseudomonas]EKX2115213.1 hypothetical protein [Pseudomonas aeruginosa]KAF0592017.1 hypothetical protein PAPB9_05071 [Pseudomonas aeruginosa]KQK62696.1 hypothetical protein AOX61_30090 [Pseudomonas aeruginosa]KQK64447.1 hypothetical protein AOX62_25700 [Pseudomonas aeruginosa]MBA5144043.1 hypothetical protein [Pseudomonas aeruginosa]
MKVTTLKAQALSALTIFNTAVSVGYMTDHQKAEAQRLLDALAAETVDSYAAGLVKEAEGHFHSFLTAPSYRHQGATLGNAAGCLFVYAHLYQKAA